MPKKFLKKDDDESVVAEEKQRRIEWQDYQHIKHYVRSLIKDYPSETQHIQVDNILYVAFSKKKSRVIADIRPIKGVWSVYRHEAYLLMVHLETWECLSEAERLYHIFHVLLHIPQFGFVQGEKDFKSLVKHDLQDFQSLIDKFGVWKEKIDLIKKNADVITSEDIGEMEDSDDEDDD
jgi:predicted metallopeptidase